MSRITIIPADNTMIVENVILKFPIEADFHALQWYDDHGEIENGNVNIPLKKSDYDKKVKPFVLLFDAEKRRLDAEVKKAEEKYNSKEQRFVRLRAKRDRLVAETDYLVAVDYPIDADKLESVKVYRQALRDITSLEGAPWDGGGDATPWPVRP